MFPPALGLKWKKKQIALKHLGLKTIVWILEARLRKIVLYLVLDKRRNLVYAWNDTGAQKVFSLVSMLQNNAMSSIQAMMIL